MDAIFKALADETRRQLLDALHRKDGQTLTELESGLGMTRFGVMKHLKVLEAASLVVTRKQGRFKYHYLNAVPLQQVIDRWIEPLTQKPLARAALDLKAKLEGQVDMDANVETRPDFVLETYIRTTPERLWQALTDGELSKNYFIANAVLAGKIEAGEPYVYTSADGNEMLKGEILQAEPGKRLEMTFNPVWMDKSREPAPVSRNVYEIEAAGDACKLTIMHFGVTAATEGVRDGWSKIAARLKTYLETGDVLDLNAA